MTYTSLQSNLPKAPYALSIAHLYGDLMNTYGDNGNILMLKYVAEKLGAAVKFDIVSLGDSFFPDAYDFVFWGGGQDYEQEVISKELSNLRESLKAFIEADKPLLAICGGFQFLGQYYVDAKGKKVEGTGILNHYSLSASNDRAIGDIEIYNAEFDETYYGFENHSGRTYLTENERPLGRVIYGIGNNEKDDSEGLRYRNVFGSYFHGPLLSRNPRLAYRLITLALRQKYGNQLPLKSYEEILSEENRGTQIADVKRKSEKKA